MRNRLYYLGPVLRHVKVRIFKLATAPRMSLVMVLAVSALWPALSSVRRPSVGIVPYSHFFGIMRPVVVGVPMLIRIIHVGLGSLTGCPTHCLYVHWLTGCPAHCLYVHWLTIPDVLHCIRGSLALCALRHGPVNSFHRNLLRHGQSTLTTGSTGTGCVRYVTRGFVQGLTSALEKENLLRVASAWRVFKIWCCLSRMLVRCSLQRYSSILQLTNRSKQPKLMAINKTSVFPSMRTCVREWMRTYLVRMYSHARTHTHVHTHTQTPLSHTNPTVTHARAHARTNTHTLRGNRQGVAGAKISRWLKFVVCGWETSDRSVHMNHCTHWMLHLQLPVAPKPGLSIIWIATADRGRHVLIVVMNNCKCEAVRLDKLGPDQ